MHDENAASARRVMSSARCDAASAGRQFENRAAGGPIRGGAVSSLPRGSIRLPQVDALPALDLPKPTRHRQAAPEVRFSARRPRRRGDDMTRRFERATPSSRGCPAHWCQFSRTRRRFDPLRRIVLAVNHPIAPYSAA